MPAKTPSAGHRRAFEAGCEGDHLVVHGGQGAGPAPLAIAGLVAEREAEGARVPTVEFVLEGSDPGWLGPALDWADAHGRRTLLRTRRVLPRALVQSLRGREVAVSLELSHHRPEIQMALLGDDAAPASALLLQAQHLGALGVPVIARVAPLVAGVHGGIGERSTGALLRNIAAADLHHVQLRVGKIDAAMLQALSRTLDGAALMDLGRAYSLAPHQVIDAAQQQLGAENERWALPHQAAWALHEGVGQMARDAGLDAHGCGCPARCDLWPERDEQPAAPYVGVLQPGLFDWARTAG